MATLPSAADVTRRGPQATGGVVTGTARSANFVADLGRPTTDGTAEAIGSAGNILSELYVSIKETEDRSALSRAQSVYSAGMLNAETKAAQAPWKERAEVYQREIRRVSDEAASGLKHDTNLYAQFSDYARQRTASGTNRVAMGILKDTRDSQVASMLQNRSEGLVELSQMGSRGFDIEKKQLIERLSAEIQDLVNTQAISESDGVTQKLALMEAYAGIEYGKLTPKEQLAAIEIARDADAKGGWEKHLPVGKLEALHDKAKRELEAETTLGNAQSVFDRLMGDTSLDYRGKRAAVRADKSLTPEERQGAIRLLDDEEARDKRDKLEVDVTTSNAIYKQVEAGATWKDIDKKEFYKLSGEQQAVIQRLITLRENFLLAQTDKKLAARLAAEAEARLPAQRRFWYEMRMAREEGRPEYFAGITQADLALGVPPDKFDEAEALLMKMHLALKQGNKGVPAEAGSAASLTNAIKHEAANMKVSETSDDFLLFEARVRAAVSEAAASRAPGAGPLSVKEQQEIIKTQTDLMLKAKRGFFGGTNTVTVPRFKVSEEDMKKTVSQLETHVVESLTVLWRAKRREKYPDAPKREPTPKELYMTYQVFQDAGVRNVGQEKFKNKQEPVTRQGATAPPVSELTPGQRF